VRVLIVDDEESIRITLAEFIKEDGYVIDIAGDAAEALGLMDKHAFDVVVTDIVLPRMNGVALMKEIRARSPDTQVIMLTGDPTVETAAEAVRAGAVDYLTKPVSKNAIRRVVANAAQIKTLTDEKRNLEESNKWYQHHLEELVEKRTAALRASEATYRTTFESTGTAMLIIEEDMTISMVNDQSVKLSGYSKNELEGNMGRQHALDGLCGQRGFGTYEDVSQRSQSRRRKRTQIVRIPSRHARGGDKEHPPNDWHDPRHEEKYCFPVRHHGAQAD